LSITTFAITPAATAAPSTRVRWNNSSKPASISSPPPNTMYGFE
jgi:hypothetical protein